MKLNICSAYYIFNKSIEEVNWNLNFIKIEFKSWIFNVKYFEYII